MARTILSVGPVAMVIGLATIAIGQGDSAMARQVATGTQRTQPDIARRDPHSFGNPEVVVVRHLDLGLEVDFDQQELRGLATLGIERQPGAAARSPLILDSRNLTILKVSAAGPDGVFAEVPYQIGAEDPILGQSITIEPGEKANQVRISYRTAPSATALQWVKPSQTAGGKRPFLFTQSQAIHARSWIPLQDSPGVRMTYEARIHVPRADDLAVMAADRLGEKDQTHRFAMPQAIPPYLIALAVGDLASAPIGPRSHVWAEPSVVPKAAFEFADTGTMIETVETRFGPYRWGDYDILVLPPSFPFGGMENPKLTFATPTVLAGDRSLVGLIAHELAHSWSGNLVTNATWRDFWLNEGFTTYLERRIVEDVFGADRAAMEWVLARRELQDEMKRLAPKDTILHIELQGRDPDDAMNSIPYEKGALFLATLEKLFGREAFDAFLRGYFDHFAFRSITTSDFEGYLREHLFEKGKVEPISIHAWLHEPGLPGDAPGFHSDRFDAVDRQARVWLDGRIKASEIKTADWSTFEWLRFLDALPPKLSVSKMAELDTALHLTDRQNAEIAQPWLLLALRSGYAPVAARLEAFLTSIGRRKYVLPLYKELASTPSGLVRAREIFARARPLYHPITVDSVERALARP